MTDSITVTREQTYEVIFNGLYEFLFSSLWRATIAKALTTALFNNVKEGEEGNDERI